MKVEQPKFLYKYRALNDNSLQILQKNKIWYSAPGSFNDPYDCNIHLSDHQFHQGWLTLLSIKAAHEGNKKLLHSIITEPMALEFWSKSQNSYKFLKEGFFAQLQAIGILSLSTRNDLMLLWSHYADNHKGFCIELSMDHDSILGKEAVPVTYSGDFPLITIDSILKDPNSSNSFWRTKSKEWEYEDEWRHMVMEGNQLHDLPARISGIVFGTKMCDSDRCIIKEASSSSSDITYTQARLVEGKFQLAIVPE